MYSSGNGTIYVINSAISNNTVEDTANTATNQIGMDDTQVKMKLYYSVVKAGIKHIDFSQHTKEELITDNPQPGPLQNNSSYVYTHTIPDTSVAVDKELYIIRFEDEYYYSDDGASWSTTLVLKIRPLPSLMVGISLNMMRAGSPT